jgi:hypothetical protein
MLISQPLKKLKKNSPEEKFQPKLMITVIIVGKTTHFLHFLQKNNWRLFAMFTIYPKRLKRGNACHKCVLNFKFSAV